MSEPRFSVGQRVQIADRTPPVHHRVPSYAKGHVGVVERVCGMHAQPKNVARSSQAQAEQLKLNTGNQSLDVSSNDAGSIDLQRRDS